MRITGRAYGRERKSKMVLPIILILVILFAGIILAYLQLSGTANVLSIVGYTSVYKAFYGHICCEEGAYEPPYRNYAYNKPIYQCNAYTDECRITLSYDKSGLNPVQYQVCNVGGGGCYSEVSRSWGSVSPIYITQGKQIEFLDTTNILRLWGDNRKYYKYDADYRLFYLEGEENGKIYVAESCILDADLKGRVLAGGLNELPMTGVSRCQNYITDYVQVATRTYDYLGKEVICQAREIYNIDEISLMDGSTEKIQGSRIKAVDCCPTEANCDVDFKFKPDVEKPCTYNYECPNAGDPVAETGTTYVKYTCVSGTCKKSTPVTVQCTNNAVCVALYDDPNKVCANWRCKDSTVPIGKCGDGKCESVIGETYLSCPEDCASKEGICPKFWQEWREEGEGGLWGILPGKSAGCYTSGWVYLVIILIIGSVLTLIIVKRRRRK